MATVTTTIEPHSTHTSDGARIVKCVLLGDEKVGQYCLLLTYSNKKFTFGYMINSWNANITVDNNPIQLTIVPTACGKDYDALRPLVYPSTDIFLLLFSVIDRESFDNVRNKWLPELQMHCPTTPYMLVGTKADLRKALLSPEDDAFEATRNRRVGAEISVEEAKEFAKQLKAVDYVECSARSVDTINVVFELAVRNVIKSQIKQKSCVIL